MGKEAEFLFGFATVEYGHTVPVFAQDMGIFVEIVGKIAGAVVAARGNDRIEIGDSIDKSDAFGEFRFDVDEFLRENGQEALVLRGELALVVVAADEDAEKVVEGRHGDVAGGNDRHTFARGFLRRNVFVMSVIRV